MGIESWTLAIAMIIVQLIFAGSQILTKLAINQGMLVLAILTYRHIVAAVCIAAMQLFFERGTDKKLTPNIGLWTFITALTGITMGMGLFYYGVKDTSATYATNFSNLIPIVTFLLSIVFRMEKLKLKTTWGQFKVFGTILCVGGALVISLYKGKPLPFFHLSSHHKVVVVIKKTSQHSLRGTILLVASCLGYALWFIAQGALASAASFYMILWAVEKKGPVYPAMFDPLSVVFVAIIEAVFFGEDITLGILVGMILMTGGLYCYLWGKKAEPENDLAPQPRQLHEAAAKVNAPLLS